MLGSEATTNPWWLQVNIIFCGRIPLRSIARTQFHFAHIVHLASCFQLCSLFPVGISWHIMAYHFRFTISTGLISPQPGDVSRTHASTTKARKLLGFQARVRIEDGVLKTIQWYRCVPQMTIHFLVSQLFVECFISQRSANA